MYTVGQPASGGCRILVVRLGAMGDIVHALPAVASLKHSYPKSRVTWVVEPKWRDLLEGNPFVDRVVLLRRGSFDGLRETWREIRSESYDLAVDFQGLIKSALTATAARPARIVGLHRSQLRERFAAIFYSTRARATSTHIVDRQLDLAVAAGATTRLRVFPLPPGRPEGELPAGPFVLACPLAGWTSKQWPLKYFRELAQRLKDELGLTLVFNGPPSAAAAFDSVPKAWPHFSGVAGLIDATRRATAVIGVDSGPLHLAAGIGVPGVAIFGPTDPARNGPYGDSITTLRAPGALTSYKRRTEIDDSMKQISPTQVFEALRAALATHPTRGARA